MTAIKLTAFSGEEPHTIPRLLPPTAARLAIDMRLEDGSLSPYRRPKSVFTFSFEGPPPNLGTIYLYGETWLGFTGLVHLAPGPVASERLYYTGDGVPKMRVEDEIFDLEVPRPATKLTATPAGGGSAPDITRTYVYTYVTEYGEESEPSPLADEITFPSDEAVTLSGFETVPTDRAIDKQRIYRTQTGTAGTDLYLIAERTAADTNFIDNLDEDQFAEPLPSRDFNPPPDDLAGLIALPNGMMAAFSGKQLCFSEPYQPHAWPEKYRLTTEFAIVGLGAIGTDVIVTTTGLPYRAGGTSPDAMTMDKIEVNLPCINARGIVDLGYAIAWPSHEGLAVATPSGAALATKNLFTREDWQALIPGTLRAGQLSGRWIGTYDTLDDDGNPFTGSLILAIDTSAGKTFMIRSAVAAKAWFYDIGNGELYFLDAADGLTIRRFDSPDGGPAAAYWRSREFILGQPQNFGVILIQSGKGASDADIAAREALLEEIAEANAALIAAGSIGGDLAADVIGMVTLAGDYLTDAPPDIGGLVSVGIYYDGVRRATIGTRDRAMRLPGGFTGTKIEIDCLTDIPVAQITLATTMNELKAKATLA